MVRGVNQGLWCGSVLCLCGAEVKVCATPQVGTEDRRVEVSNSELATTFYFLIIVGYYLRQLEVSLLSFPHASRVWV